MCRCGAGAVGGQVTAADNVPAARLTSTSRWTGGLSDCFLSSGARVTVTGGDTFGSGQSMGQRRPKQDWPLVQGTPDT